MICVSQIYDNGSIWRRVCRAFSPDKSDRSGFIFGGIRPSSLVSIFLLWPSRLVRQCYETDRTVSVHEYPSLIRLYLCGWSCDISQSQSGIVLCLGLVVPSLLRCKYFNHLSVRVWQIDPESVGAVGIINL
jgi:hypothetical protein